MSSAQSPAFKDKAVSQIWRSGTFSSIPEGKAPKNIWRSQEACDIALLHYAYTDPTNFAREGPVNGLRNGMFELF